MVEQQSERTKHNSSSSTTVKQSDGTKKQWPTKMKRTNENTVFFRYAANTAPQLTRSHFESFFSDIGPVKKCSVIRKAVNTKNNTKDAKGYGFCKFSFANDAQQAAATLNDTFLHIDNTKKVKVYVDIATNDTTERTTPKRDASKLPPGTPDTDTEMKSTTELQSNEQNEELELIAKKRTARVIVRNLSFYAGKQHIATVFSKFGPVLDIHIPSVPGTNKQMQHRGFAFVTFTNPKHAIKAVNSCAKEPILIKKRPVAIDFSIPKLQHVQMKKEEATPTDNDDKDDDDDEKEDNEDNDEDDEEKDDEDDEKGDNDEESGDEEEEESQSDSATVTSETNQELIPVVPKKKNNKHELFLRNLPFDATRHDLFQVFRQYGRVEGIFLVKDKMSGMNRGTAFVQYQTHASCERVLELSSPPTTDTPTTTTDNDATVLPKTNNTTAANDAAAGGGGLYLFGRRILVDLAVDKNTAESLKVERDEEGKIVNRNKGKDLRNLYLKGEGRVEDTDTATNDDNDDTTTTVNEWENLPESDKDKRGRAHKEKHTKLRSPLFFINPFRLSLRNLSKHITECELKTLLVTGVSKGLEKNLVNREDVIAHWKAGGDMSTRDIVHKISKLESDDTEQTTTTTKTDDTTKVDKVIPSFDEQKRGIKHYIPSVYIDRDFQAPIKNTKAEEEEGGAEEDRNKKSKGTTVAPSRGFAFAEFTNHAHALACLRELNNNPLYASTYVAGGKKAMDMKKRISNKKTKRKKKGGNDDFVGTDGKVKIPRLIVEFTVENKAKARKQAENRAIRVANTVKQKASLKQKKKEEEDDDDDKEKSKKKHKSRGAIQRERKRKRKEAEQSGNSNVDAQQPVITPKAPEKEETTKNVSPKQEEPVSPPKSTKPPKKKKQKKKIEKEEVAFEDMVRSYKKAFAGDIAMEPKDSTPEQKSNNPREDVTKKRWFD